MRRAPSTGAGEVVAGGLFTECGGIVQAHLIGTANAYLSLSPAKSLMDFARSWARQHGWRTLHIGGGRGGREDSLFRFKREFSPTRHDFAVGRWVLDADAYRRLSKARYGGAPEASPGEYFPAYRAPVAADQASDTDTAAG
jgi:hypothetical protein